MKKIISLIILLGLTMTSFTAPRHAEEPENIPEEPQTEQIVVRPVETETPVIEKKTYPPLRHDASVCIEVEDDKPIITLTEEDRADILALAQTANGEYNLTDTPEHKMMAAAVMWCACWRSLNGSAQGFSDTIRGCCAQSYQFLGYNPKSVPGEDLMALAEDVLIRFRMVQNGASVFDAGCVLQSEYLWFHGNGSVNIFRNKYQGGNTWDWSLPNPYKEV